MKKVELMFLVGDTVKYTNLDNVEEVVDCEDEKEFVIEGSELP